MDDGRNVVTGRGAVNQEYDTTICMQKSMLLEGFPLLVSAGGILLLDRAMPTWYIHCIFRQPCGSTEEQLI